MDFAIIFCAPTFCPPQALCISCDCWACLAFGDGRAGCAPAGEHQRAAVTEMTVAASRCGMNPNPKPATADRNEVLDFLWSMICQPFPVCTVSRKLEKPDGIVGAYLTTRESLGLLQPSAHRKMGTTASEIVLSRRTPLFSHRPDSRPLPATSSSFLEGEHPNIWQPNFKPALAPDLLAR